MCKVRRWRLVTKSFPRIGFNQFSTLRTRKRSYCFLEKGNMNVHNYVSVPRRLVVITLVGRLLRWYFLLSGLSVRLVILVGMDFETRESRYSVIQSFN